MGINFPTAPTVGQKYPLPAVPGVPTYTWDGEKWTTDAAAVGEVGGTSVIVSSTPPVGVPDNTLWWEDDTGQLYVYYNDGTSTQWITAVPHLDPSAFATKAYVDTKLSQTISLAGGRSFDMTVPSTASLAKITAIIFPTTSTTFNTFLQVSLSPGVFKTTAGDYSTTGFYHNPVAPNTIASLVSDTTRIGMIIAGGHANSQYPMHITGTLTVRKPDTAHRFTGNFHSQVASSVLLHYFYESGVSDYTNPAPQILAFRIMSNLGDNWAAGSFLEVEWV